MGADSRRWPGWSWVLVVLAATVVLGGCNNSDGTTPTVTASPTPSSATTSPSASSSATKSETAAERDKRLAGEAVARYLAVIDDLAANPDKSVNLIDPIARDQARAQSRVRLATYAEKGWVQTGEVSVSDVKVTTSDGKAFNVVACVDVTEVDFLDEQGKSQVSPDRPDRQKITYGVTKTSDGFFVTDDPLTGTPC